MVACTSETKKLFPDLLGFAQDKFCAEYTQKPWLALCKDGNSASFLRNQENFSSKHDSFALALTMPEQRKFIKCVKGTRIQYRT